MKDFIVWLNRIRAWLPWCIGTVDDVLGVYTRACDRLNKVEKNMKAEADAHAQAVAVAQKAQAEAEAEVKRAEAIRNNIEKIINPSE